MKKTDEIKNSHPYIIRVKNASDTPQKISFLNQFVDSETFNHKYVHVYSLAEGLSYEDFLKELTETKMTIGPLKVISSVPFSNKTYANKLELEFVNKKNNETCFMALTMSPLQMQVDILETEDLFGICKDSFIKVLVKENSFLDFIMFPASKYKYDSE